MNSLNKRIAFCAFLMLFAHLIRAEVRKYDVSENDGFQWVRVDVDDKYGAQTKNGSWLVPAQFYHVYYFEGYLNGESALGAAIYDLKGKCLISDSRGYKTIYSHQEEPIKWFEVHKNGFIGSCDKDGVEIIAPSRGYSQVTLLEDDGIYYFEVKKGGKEGICDIRGKEIIAPTYNKLIVSYGVVRSQEGNGWVDVPKSKYPDWPTSKTMAQSSSASTASKSTGTSSSSTKKSTTSGGAGAPKSSATTAKSGSNTSVQATKGSTTGQQKRYYSTWMILPSSGSYFVVGKGIEESEPVLEFTDNKIKAFGLEKGETPILNYVKKDSKGFLVYQCKAPGQKGKLVTYQILINSERSAFNFIHLVNGMPATIRNFVSDKQLSKKIIAANMDLVTPGNPNFLNGNNDNGSSSNNSSGSVSGSDRKNNQTSQKSCSFCGGSGISPVQSSNAGSRTVYTNSKGNLCPYCGLRTYHFHDRCPSCK